MPDTIRRDSHKPHACSGGKTALTCRNVVMLAMDAERDRSDPRVGTDSVMRMSQHKMVTFVNGNVVAPHDAASGPPRTGSWRLHDQNLAGARGDRLLYTIGAVPFGRQQEEGTALRAAEHRGENGPVVFNPL